MNKFERRLKREQNIGKSLILILGFLMVAGGAIWGGFINKESKNQIDVDATITNITYDWYDETHETYVLFYYDVDGDGEAEALPGKLDTYKDSYEIGDSLKVKINLDDLDYNSSEGYYYVSSGTTIQVYIFIGFGVLLCAIGILTLKSNKNGYYNKNIEQASPSEINNINEQIKVNPESYKEFDFSLDKPTNKYIVKDTDGNVDYEIIRLNHEFFKGTHYKFSNLSSLSSYDALVGGICGSTTTTLNQTTTNMWFKINGIKCWDYLKQKGITIKNCGASYGVPSFQVYKFNEVIGKIDAKVSSNVYSFKSVLGILNSFKINGSYDYLDDLVLTCFVVSIIYKTPYGNF